MDDDEYNGSDSDAQFDAELGALKFKMSKRKIGGSSVCALLIMYIACIHGCSSRRPLQRFYIRNYPEHAHQNQVHRSHLHCSPPRL